ncbi:MAG: DUF72 domain-containing protein [Alphaproteobacteria bacterium]|nr:DUF72 domain-containing protein [Alphaproteobacteria bacterium]MBU2085689.1 DUF72 domain-containing protein [Alphaproteobacteria bacterium]MBU2141626.1 DUF72 domain-containing protein [Alphaproteobacteria bacterium]MBU2197590.1 DUF72 domain-containing protein [Alphaproteobacteria bacterium]
MAHHIRVGTGGWSYEPWWEPFYPADVPKTKELSYASRQLTAIEINFTFYRNQPAHVFAFVISGAKESILSPPRR